MQSRRPDNQVSTRAAFTLIELLVVVAIMLLMTFLTVALIETNAPADRMRAGCRQVQSALLGARDRAIHAGRTQNARPVGLRFQIDSEYNTVSSFVYVQALPPHRAGDIQLRRPDDDMPFNEADSSDVTLVYGTGTGWYRLYRRGLIDNGSRIQIPYGGGWYSINVSRLSATDEILEITPAFRDSTPNDFPAVEATPIWPADPVTRLGDYQLELSPAVMPGQEPIRLPEGVAIQLSNSYNIPPATRFFDVMFSARGTIHGPLAAKGLMHFYLANVQDIVEGIAPNASQREKMLVTLFTQSGHVSTFPVDPADLYRYAREGSVANQ